MASVYLDPTDTFTVSNNNIKVYGSTGTEVVTVATGVTGLTFDQATERVALQGNVSAYTYQQQGNQLVVYSGATAVATIPLQNDANGTQVTFADGTVDVTVSAAGMKLGGTAVVAGTVAGTATTLVPTTIDPAVTTTPIAGGGTVTGQSYALTLNDVAGPFDQWAATAGNDTITGASGTLQTGDTILDTSTTDADVLTALVTTAIVNPTITKIETVNINGEFITTGLDLGLISGTKTMNFNTGITSGTATVGLTTATSGAKTTAVQNIAFGSYVTTATINADATGTAGAVNVNSGAAVGTLTFVGASLADSYIVSTNANLKLAGVDTVETLKVIPTVANTKITFQEAYTVGKTLDIGGTVNTILAGTTANLTGRATTKSSTGVITVLVNDAGLVDTTLMAGISSVTLGAASAAAITVNTGVSLTTAINQTAGFTITGPAVTATTNANTFTNTSALQAAVNDASLKNLTLVSAAPQVSGVDATYTALDMGANNVILSGTNDVVVTIGTALNVDASALVGFLNYTQGVGAVSAVAADTATTIKGGSGANIVTFSALTTNVTYIGKDAGDSVTLASTTGSASITTGAGDDTITANTVTTGAITISTGAGDDTVSATGLTTGVISANLGDGNDTLTLGAILPANAVVVAIDGGLGTDVINIPTGADFSNTGSAFSATSIETINLTGAGVVTFSAAELSGKTQFFKGTVVATENLIVKGVAGTTTIDLSAISTDQTIAGAVDLGTTIIAIASTSAVTIKGTAQLDTITVSANGSTVTPGGGIDTVTFTGGADKMLYAAATPAALLTEAGTTVSGVGTALPTGAGDTITAFALGIDKIVLTAAFGTAGAGLVKAGGTSYTAASTTLSAADFVTVANIATATITADTANGGRFIFDQVTSILYYDASGNTTANGAGAYTGAADDFVVATIIGIVVTATDFAFA